MASILIIEDDVRIRESVARALADRGHDVGSARLGMEGVAIAVEGTTDLVVLDLGLPDIDGATALKMIRAVSEVPVIIATARDDQDAVVDLLDLGADDYVVKPFQFEEVIARVNALVRRSGGWASSIMTAGPISLDLSRQEVKVNDAVIELTSYEYKIIEYLIVRAGQVISKTELTERLYDQDFERDSNVIEVFVGRLRKKLDPDNTIQPIETLRGRGYRFGLERNQSA